MADESLQSEQEEKKVDTEKEVNPDGVGTPGDTASEVDDAEQSDEDVAPVEEGADDAAPEGEADAPE